MSEPIGVAKSALRREILAVLRKMDSEERDQRSRAICDDLLSLPEVKDAQYLLTFASMKTEPDLGFLWSAELPLVFPRVDGKRLDLFLVREEGALTIGSFGIREPDPERCELISPNKIDTILVPGVAFCPANGDRMGRGGGFYDRLLEGCDAKTIGVCFTEQLRDEVPTEKHDCPVDLVVAK